MQPAVIGGWARAQKREQSDCALDHFPRGLVGVPLAQQITLALDCIDEQLFLAPMRQRIGLAAHTGTQGSHLQIQRPALRVAAQALQVLGTQIGERRRVAAEFFPSEERRDQHVT